MKPSRPADEKRYDRQIRIWQHHGQAALESARVCLFTAGATGAEALKNLVLGGIASFTIVDGARVTARDLGTNFLLDAACLGSARAQAVAELLKELNDSVEGSFIVEEPAALVEANPNFLEDFDLVIATQMVESDVLKLEKATRKRGVRLLVARSYGLIGYLQISIAEHTVVEPRPDNTVEDLRLAHPWTELREFAASFDLASMGPATHKQLPYAVLLIKAAEEWRRQHKDQLPANKAERSAFKDLIASWQQHVDNVALEEDNFEEALNNAHKLTAAPNSTIPSEIAALLADPCTAVTASSSDFWFLTAALKTFVERTGQLPLEGSVPDMTASTDIYLRLQRIYRERATKDVEAVESALHELLAANGRQPGSIAHSDVRTFCKNARHLRVIRNRSISEEVDTHTLRSDAVRAALSSEGTATNAALYLLLRAVDRFVEAHQRAPGAEAEDCEADVPVLKSFSGSILSESGAQSASSAVSDDLLGEMCRFGGGELHCVAAIVGGMAAQEAIKLITAQFVPICGTLIYNAMSSTTSALPF